MFFPSAAQQALIDRYAVNLRKKLVAVVGEALAKVAPCRLAWGTGQVAFAINRRNNPYAEIGERIANGSLVGPVDHDVPVLSVVDRQGELRAVVFGYACHPIWLRHFRVWSGDYPGVAQMRLEQSHPEAMALFWAGCGGDQNPVSRGGKLEREEMRSPLLDESWKQSAIDEVEFLGNELATAVESVLHAEPVFLGGSLDYAYRETEIPLAHPPQREELTRTMLSTDQLASRLAGQALSDLDAGRASRQSYPYPTQVWRLGDHFIVALGGETVVDYSLRLKRQLGAKTTWAAGYTNDVMAYIPSRRVLLEGGYEGGGAMVYYGLHSAWDPRIEEIIVQTVTEQVDQLRKIDGP